MIKQLYYHLWNLSLNGVEVDSMLLCTLYFLEQPLIQIK